MTTVSEKNYCIKLVSAYSVIALPTTMENIKSIKIKKIQYRFITPNQNIMTLSINGYDQNTYFDGVNQDTYTLSLFNNGVLNSVLNYTNVSGFPDVSFVYGNPLTIFTLIVKIDGVQTPDITPTNPLFLELSWI